MQIIDNPAKPTLFISLMEKLRLRVVKSLLKVTQLISGMLGFGLIIR